MAMADTAYLVPLAEVPHLLKPRRGRHISKDAVRLWCLRGFTHGGRLKYSLVEGRWMIDLNDLREFVDAMGCAEMK